MFADAHYTSAIATHTIATLQQGHVKNVRENGMALRLIKCNSIHSHLQSPRYSARITRLNLRGTAAWAVRLKILNLVDGDMDMDEDWCCGDVMH